MTDTYGEYHYMLMFSLGPVQPFIEQARKSRDLWLGSFLISTLMEAALAYYTPEKAQKQEAQLIFPTEIVLENNVPDIPNKYVALFRGQSQAEEEARKSKKAIFDCWEKICEDVWSLSTLNDYPESKEIWVRQTNPKTLFELFWVVVEGDTKHYNKWLEQTQQALDARKRVRDFQHYYKKSDGQVELVHELGEKSTISGRREALRGADASREGVRKFWEKLAERLSEQNVNQKGTERLDAIDFVKRFAFQSPIIGEKVSGFTEGDGHKQRIGYPSTSTIAAAPYIEQLLRQLKKDHTWSGIAAWKSITSDYKPLAEMPASTLPYLYKRAEKQQERLLKRDGDCYFPDTFTPNRLQKTYGLMDNTLPAIGQQALRDLLTATKALDITPPTPYYAVMVMDGDRMGTLLSKVEGPARHIAISKALSTFAREQVKVLVEECYPGRLIYAGGDDVFALAPLLRDRTGQVIEGEKEAFFSIFQLADALQETYSKTLCAALRPEGSQASGGETVNEDACEIALEFEKIGVSASMGLAITHHYTSLSYVRRVVKEAEEMAKHAYGRNALVVSVIRRSGEQTTVGCHWRYPELKQEGLLQPLKLFECFLELFKQDVLSPKCTYILLDEAPALIGMADTLGIVDIEQDVRVSEIKRVFLRQYNPQSTYFKKSDKEELDSEKLNVYFTKLAQNIVLLAEAIDNDPGEDGAPRIPKKQRVLELHADRPRRGLIEVLGWLQVMVFLTRKGQE